MLGLSQTTGYAILALSCLDEAQGQLTLARKIAACTKIPLPYLWKIMHALGRYGLVRTKRGYRGGFSLSRPADQISLLEVVQAVEGPNWLPACLIGLPDDDLHRNCPTRSFWRDQCEKIRLELQRVTLADIAAFERQCGRTLSSSDSETPSTTEALPVVTESAVPS